MVSSKALALAVVLGTVLNLSACRRNPPSASSEPKPDQIQPASKNGSESPDQKSCRAFVQKFYDWRVSLLIDTFCPNPLKGTAADQEAISRADEECTVVSSYRNAEKLNPSRVLSPRLQHYLKREAQAQGPDDPGLDFDPYLNTQDPSPRYLVDSVRVDGNRCDAVVHGYDEGQQREEVMPELFRANGRWLIENFHYKFNYNDGKPPQDDDLIHMIREYIGEVK